jgi:hypothetical protein
MRFDGDDMARRLAVVLRRWLRERSDWAQRWSPDTFTSEWRSVDEIATELVEDAEFAELRMGPFLQSPEGNLIETAVSRLLPFPESYEFRLLVEAINQAGGAKTRNDRQAAGAWMLVSVGLAALLWLGRDS